MSKRKRLDSSSRNIEHYFKKNSSTTTTTIRFHESESFENDLERAIKQSLADHSLAGAPTAEEAVQARNRIKEPDTPSDATANNCPICGKALSLTADANEHINKCLDDNECSPEGNIEQHEEATKTECIPKLMSNHGSAKPAATDLLRSEPDEWTSKQESSAESSRPIRKCPFYKWIQGTPFVVDAFSFGKIEKCQGYFLSHYHSDHYHGLSSSWSHGPIYCSKVTANYVQHKLDVDPKYIVALPMNQEYPLSSDVNVCPIEANHCPGSVLFLFKVFRPDGSIDRHLHTGDFRANPRMCLHPLIRQPENDVIDTLYLDTTYLDGHYSFPAQEEVITAACDLAEQCVSGVQKEDEPSVLHSWLQKAFGAQPPIPDKAATSEESRAILFVVGTYSIGKERLFYNLARRLKSKIYAPEPKRKLISYQENNELDSMLTDDPLKAQVHVVPLRQIQEEALSLYLKSLEPHFTSVVAFRPTGWTFRKSSPATASLSEAPLATITLPPSDRTVVLRPQKTTIDTVKVYGVPYSEHSSFRELASFIASLRIQRIIPTVNVGSEKSRQKQYAILNRWQKEKQKKGIQFVSYQTEEHW